MKQSRVILLIIALLVCAAQLYTPVSMALRYEDVLSTGTSYRFLVEPIDPADPFKGRYVRLTFPIERGTLSSLGASIDKDEFKRKDKAFITLDNNPQGRAVISNILREKPASGDYIAVKINYLYDDKYGIDLPFDRYYAEEFKAPKIESIVWDRNRLREDAPEIIADVRIKEGAGVIAELYVGDVPILEFLKLEKVK